MIDYNFHLDHIIITHRHLDHIGGVNNVLDMITNKKGNIIMHFIINIHFIYVLVLLTLSLILFLK